jgi:EAL domain-containing protein (putative c-di-GMP-specific phosphodiesterase class I)
MIQPIENAADPAAARAQPKQWSVKPPYVPGWNDASIGADWQATCEYGGLRLKSEFQAIRDLPAGTVVGHIARVRPFRDDNAVPVEQLFCAAGSDAEIVRMDRLCRVLHATNYHAEGLRPTRLLVPAHPRLLNSVPADHGRVYRKALNRIGLKEAPIVVCLPDPEHLRTMSLGYLIGSYRLHGFEIAVSLRHASGLTDLLARTRPNFVLLDVRQCDSVGELSAAVAAADSAGSRIVFTMVESAGAGLRVRKAGGRLAQGRYFDKRDQRVVAELA